jgi:hypothetical protein
LTVRTLKLSLGSRNRDGSSLPNPSSMPSISPPRRFTTAMCAPTVGTPLWVWAWVSKNIAPADAPKNHLNWLSRTCATGARLDSAVCAWAE